MKRLFKTIFFIALYCKCIASLKHHLVLTNDFRYVVSVSSFGYNIGGRLDVIVQNLSLSPDPSEETESPQFGFALVKSHQTRNSYSPRPFQQGYQPPCLLDDPKNWSRIRLDLMTLALLPKENKILVRCAGDNNVFPAIRTLAHDPRKKNESSHGSYIHTYNKRAAKIPSVSSYSNDRYHECFQTSSLPLEHTTDVFGRKHYSFNFTMSILNDHEEGNYYMSFLNCKGDRGPIHYDSSDRERSTYTTTRFNLSLLIFETNWHENYLSAGAMPLPQMYFMFSVMFFLIGCVWVNYISRQKENILKIHKLMTVLVFAKACSVLFHGINYHYIALDGQPVVTWAYLYYATRSVKGALFFITLTLIGSGWTLVKHILSPKDKKIILVIVALQVTAHIAEIILDESTEGEASIEFWAELCGLVDLCSCIVIIIPITWSVRHLQEASRTDGKAAQNLKKMELFKKFYIITTIYIYVTRIMTFVFLSVLAYKYSWLAELFTEMATLIYLVITGYYFQPMQTNPYLLLSSENDFEEDILFSVDAHDLNGTQMEEMRNSGESQDRSTLLDEEGKTKKKRRVVEDFV